MFYCLSSLCVDLSTETHVLTSATKNPPSVQLKQQQQHLATQKQQLEQRLKQLETDKHNTEENVKKFESSVEELTKQKDQVVQQAGKKLPQIA